MTGDTKATFVILMGDTSRDGSVARADVCGMGRCEDKGYVTWLGGSIAVQHLRFT